MMVLEGFVTPTLLKRMNKTVHENRDTEAKTSGGRDPYKKKI